jgi:hypothetical protein
MLPDRFELPVPATARENKDSNLVWSECVINVSRMPSRREMRDVCVNRSLPSNIENGTRPLPWEGLDDCCPPNMLKMKRWRNRERPWHQIINSDGPWWFAILRSGTIQSLPQFTVSKTFFLNYYDNRWEIKKQFYFVPLKYITPAPTGSS